ncbi:hypothetical protein AMR72_01750 [Flavobacterium psychrophilum]|nr:hypothetical protein AMR72_01750 [Flavobacterium psychrophilum]AOE51359.1 hypothetical protein ALW18_01750 [Flavobacterium psychrophilum]
MRKQLLTGALLLTALFSANAQQTLFQDNFDSYDDFIIDPIGSWTQIDLDGAPTYGIQLDEQTSVAFQNSGYVGTAIVFNQSATDPVLDTWTPVSGAKTLNFFAAIPTANNDWVITPKIRLGSTGNVVKFSARSITADYGLERIKVAVSTTGNTNTDDFTVITAGNYVEVPVDWTEYSLNLDAYNGQDVYIAINYVTDDAFALLVDDFSVTTTGTVGLNDNLASQFSVSPNPANNIININSSNNALINGAEIVDMNGRTVKTATYNGISDAQINISDLSSGVYMMNLTSDQGKTTKKIIKN